MGRPLFSQTTYDNQASAVTVRVEPEREPTQPAFERWTYWNPFDPDSEEFFVDAEEERVRTLDGPLAADGEARGDASLVEEMSSGSSEGTASGRETPVFADDGPSIEELNLEARRRASERVLAAQAIVIDEAPSYEGRTYRATQARISYSPAVYTSSRAATSYVRTPYHVDQLSRSPSPTRIPRTEVAVEPVAVARPEPTRSAPIAIPARPSTPPNQISYSYGTPSPAPSVTPRLYTWRPPPLPTVASPGSPLPNRSARMSVAHISPSIIQRVVG